MRCNEPLAYGCTTGMSLLEDPRVPPVANRHRRSIATSPRIPRRVGRGQFSSCQADSTPAALMLLRNDWLPVACKTCTKLANVERSASHSTCHMVGRDTAIAPNLGERTLEGGGCGRNHPLCTTTPRVRAKAPTRTSLPLASRTAGRSNEREERESGEGRGRCTCRT